MGRHERDTRLLPFCRELKRLGFQRDPKWRHLRNPLLYVKVVGPRELDVQLWRDGRHRASHSLNGRMSTYPTEFAKVAQVRAAVYRELTRLDHTPRI